MNNRVIVRNKKGITVPISSTVKVVFKDDVELYGFGMFLFQFGVLSGTRILPLRNAFVIGIDEHLHVYTKKPNGDTLITYLNQANIEGLLNDISKFDFTEGWILPVDNTHPHCRCLRSVSGGGPNKIRVLDQYSNPITPVVVLVNGTNLTIHYQAIEEKKHG